NEINTIIVEDEEPWANGEIAYKLGDAYGQQIGVDPLPVLGGMTVYEIELADGRKVYTNDPYEEYHRGGLTPGNMGTICLPWASDLYIGATFYRLLHKELNESGEPYNIVLEEVTELQAGVPYVFIPEENQIHVYYLESTEVAEEGNSNGLYGTFEDINDGEAGNLDNKLENNYVVYNNMFQHCGEYCWLNANRAYIRMDDVALQGAQNAPAPVPGRRHVMMGGTVPHKTPTDVQSVEWDSTDSGTYDVLGRRINGQPNAHGVYIINGKKVIK
ncbi:MAG: hypothetical protein J6T32_03110, partial [Paludibacteraceae bacterium]|nr:hypothetical protein [Paludibacteraceae bacterium]